MFNCQFCGFDYSEQGLRDGRCPSCGVLLAWEDESQAPDNAISDSELPSAPLPYTAPPPDLETAQPAPESALPSDEVPAAAEPVSEADSEPVSWASPGAASAQPPEEASPPPSTSFAPATDAASEPSAEPTPVDEDEASPDEGGSPPEPVIGGQTIRRDIDPSQLFSAEVPEDDDAKYSQAVEQIWSRSITKRPNSTIQTPSSHGTVSNLVIRQRAVSKGEVAEPKSPVDYELLGVIGEGGVGVVYSARQASINRTVAVKMLREQDDATNDKSKFLAEAVVTGELDHPNIVPIYDLGSNEEGALFYSMKQVQGTPWFRGYFQ